MAKEKLKTKQNRKKTVSTEQQNALRKMNLWLSALFAVQAAAIAVIGTAKTAPVTTNYLAVDPLASEGAGEQVLAVASRHLFDIRVAWIVALFLLVFAVVHFLAATTLRARYESRLKVGMNDFRWIGFGVGGGVMLVVIALLSGIHELTSLIMLFGLMLAGSVGILCAEEIARREQQKKALLSHVVCAVGTLGLLAPWVVVGIAAGGAMLYEGVVPSFMCGIYVSMFAFFVIGFLLTHFRIKKQGRLADTLLAEWAYMLFGLLAASALAWQVFVGVLQP